MYSSTPWSGICSSRDSEVVNKFTWESEVEKTELCRGGRLFPPALRWCRTSVQISTLVVIQKLQMNLPESRRQRGLNSAGEGGSSSLLYAGVELLIRQLLWSWYRSCNWISTWESERRGGEGCCPPCCTLMYSSTLWSGICPSRDSEVVNEFTWESEVEKTELCRGGWLFPPVLRWCRTPGQTSALVVLQKSCL